MLKFKTKKIQDWVKVNGWQNESSNKCPLLLVLSNKDKEKEKVIIIRVLKLKSSYKVEVYYGSKLSITKSRSKCIKKSSIPSEFKALKIAASYFHKNIHKKNKPYKVVYESYDNNLIKLEWKQLENSLPCQIPFIEEIVEENQDINFLNKLSVLEIE